MTEHCKHQNKLSFKNQKSLIKKRKQNKKKNTKQEIKQYYYKNSRNNNNKENNDCLQKLLPDKEDAFAHDLIQSVEFIGLHNKV